MFYYFYLFVPYINSEQCVLMQRMCFPCSGIPGKNCGTIILTAEELGNCRVSVLFISKFTLWLKAKSFILKMKLFTVRLQDAPFQKELDRYLFKKVIFTDIWEKPKISFNTFISILLTFFSLLSLFAQPFIRTSETQTAP